jgi:hypothetical protein
LKLFPFLEEIDFFIKTNKKKKNRFSFQFLPSFFIIIIITMSRLGRQSSIASSLASTSSRRDASPDLPELHKLVKNGNVAGVQVGIFSFFQNSVAYLTLPLEMSHQMLL